MSAAAPRLVHVTTTDISLALLLGPQLRAFAAAGYEVIGASAPGRHVAALERDGIRHVAVRHATRSMAPGRDVAAFDELRRLFEALRPEIVHTHNPKPGVYGRLAAAAARVPVRVNTVHGLYATEDDRARRRLPVYALERMAARCSHAELVQNPEDIETLARIGVPRSKLTLLGNGIELTRFDPDRVGDARRAVRTELGIDDGTVVIGCVGRLVAEKGWGELLTAFERVKASGPPVALVAVGPHDPEKSDALDIGSLDARPGVHAAGERDDVERWYAAFDVFVLPSWREGFPRSAMEAAAMGLPVVATDIRGCRQVVDHERTGLLVPPRDPDALAGAIAGLVADPERRARYGRAGRAKAVAEFDDRRVIQTTLATYQRLRSGS